MSCSAESFSAEFVYTDVWSADEELYLVTTRDELFNLYDRFEGLQPQCNVGVLTEDGRSVYVCQFVSISVSEMGYALSFKTPVTIEFQETWVRVSLDACRTANLAAVLQQFKAVESVSLC